MFKLLALTMLLTHTIIAQTWTAATVPTTVVVDGMRINFIGLHVSTNRTTKGMIGISRMAGSNEITRQTTPIASEDLNNILAACDTTLTELGTLLLEAGKLTGAAEFVTKADIVINPVTGRSTVTITTLSGRRVIIPEDTVNTAMLRLGSSVAIFQHAFLAYAKTHTR